VRNSVVVFFSALINQFRLQLQRIDTMNTEMESYKRSIVKEQELNEKLTLVLNRTKYEIQNLEKLLQINSEKSDTIKQEISTYTKALEETQLMLNRVNTVKRREKKSFAFHSYRLFYSNRKKRKNNMN
jgi:septal ring factor EnvC (AmiA/AmiB activator)